MRVAVCANLELKQTGGVETHIRALTEAMRELDFAVDVFGKSSGQSWRSLREFNPEGYDIIHTHGCLFPLEVLHAMLTRRRRQRFVHTLHGVSLDYLVNVGAWSNRRCYQALCIEGILSVCADHVIAVCEQIKERARQCFRLPSDKVSVIPNGHKITEDALPDRTWARERFGFGPDDMVLIFVGRGSDRVKGTALIQRAMTVLHKMNPHIKLLAVPGEGFQPAKWLHKSGKTAHDAMGDCYRAGDIFINASLNEGLPLTVLEAMATGVPVIAAPVGGISEIIRDGDNGLLLNRQRSNLINLILRLINRPEYYKNISDKARNSVRLLNWGSIANDTINVYKRLRHH